MATDSSNIKTLSGLSAGVEKVLDDYKKVDDSYIRGVAGEAKIDYSFDYIDKDNIDYSYIKSIFNIDTPIDNMKNNTTIYANYIKVKNDNFIYTIDSNMNVLDIEDLTGKSVLEQYDMFSNNAHINANYGGNQGSLMSHENRYQNDKYIDQILEKYFQDTSISCDDKSLLFSKMNEVGCGYIASINIILESTKYLSDEDFYNKFGFPRYTYEKIENCEYERQFNYNYLFLDFFLNYNKEDGKEMTIEKLCSNEEVEDFSNISFGAGNFIDNKDIVGATGTFSRLLSPSIHSYLLNKGVIINYDNSKKTTQQSINEALEDGNMVSVSLRNFTCYEIDKDGNIQYDKYKTYDGGHCVIVTESLGNGKYIMSSWGKKYAFEIDENTISTNGLIKSKVEDISIYKI